MSNGVSFADVLFILLVCGVIYFFVYWIGPARKELKKTESHQRTDSDS